MKKILNPRVFCLIVAFSLFYLSVEAAQYYVVIGTFAQEANARSFTGKLRGIFRDASYSFNEERQLYYVHVLKTARKEEARELSVYLKHQKGYSDAWVFTDGAAEQHYAVRSVDGVPAQVVKNHGEAGGERMHREARLVAERNTAMEMSPVFASAGRKEEIMHYEPGAVAEASGVALQWTHSNDVSYIGDIRNINHIKDNDGLANGQLFTFIVEDTEGRSIPAEVLLVSFEKSKKIAGFRAGELAAIRAARKGQMVTLVCEELGYGMETRMFNMDHLGRGRDIRKNKDGVWEVRFKLKKMERYDMAILYKTAFYPNAAILESASRGEMDALADMLKANPTYKIIVHTHCNPGEKRDILLPGDDNFFDAKGSETIAGSDRKLTKARGETIRQFLISQGIDKKRIGLVGWGSMELMVDASSEDAAMNERVEIELVED
ncbi:MAG: OmpA family protein [Chryseosolibacter sp.]